MRFLVKPILWVFTFHMATSGGIYAQENPVVIELFTSQGCPACPPANDLLGELSQRADVIALALHVDYWDYIGWVDTFASPQFTRRQRGYSHAAGVPMVYTPQMIVDGQHHVMGNRPMEIADLIMRHTAANEPMLISVIRNDDNGAHRIEAEFVNTASRGQRLDVHLVSYMPHDTVDVARGENAGRLTNHYNVVRSWTVMAEWDGQTPFSTDLTLENDLPHVVLFQSENHGPILGAVRVN